MNIYKIIKWAALLNVILTLSTNAQWVKLTFPSSEDLLKVRFASQDTGWVLGTNHIFKTTNGGITWIIQDSVWSAWEGLYALNNSTVLYYDHARGIRRTIDGGTTWATVDTSKYNVYNFSFLNSKLGFAACGGIAVLSDTGVVRRTTDGGETWETIAALNVGVHNDDFEKVSFVDSLHGWAVTYGAKIYKTIDGGFNWQFLDSIGTSLYLPLRDIQFINLDSGWVAGGISGSSIIASTTDGGKTWGESASGATVCNSSLREISMINSNIGWVTGVNDFRAFIAKTTDGGTTWIDQTPAAENIGFESISIVNDSVGYVVGPTGSFYKTTNGGITAIFESNKDLITRYKLSQNYPNPFNPTTTINYYVPKTSFVTIKVYDVLGNELATLVNEEKKAGNYGIHFAVGTRQLASGVYIYRMQAGSFVETKKLILLK